jgi:hypothetical protein
VEDKPTKSKTGVLEIDYFDLLDGKMNGIAMERLHKQLCSKGTVKSSDEILCPDNLVS